MSWGNYIDPDLVIDNIRTIYIGPDGDVEEVVVMDGDSICSRDGWIRMGRNADDVNVVHDAANPQDEEFSYYSDWRPHDREWNINYGTGDMVMEDGEVLTREQVNERFGVDEIYDIPEPLDRGNNPNDGGKAPVHVDSSSAGRRNRYPMGIFQEPNVSNSPATRVRSH